MTKTQFEKAPFLARKIQKLSEPVSDTVRGSSPLFPYDGRTYGITGVPADRQKQLEQYRDELAEIERFILSRGDEEQELLRAVAKYGTRWDVVRREIGTWKSPDAVRKRYERIFKK